MGNNFTTSFADFEDKYGSQKLGKSSYNIQERLDILSKKRFSDITSDKDGKTIQWVNYVQQGGGTLGISLVGYTTVLEYVGIRFLRVAGTSAGAINTLFLAAIGEKDDPKMPELYNLMNDQSRFPLKKFVDTKSWVLKKIIYSLGRGQGLVKNVINFLITLILITPLIILPIFSHISKEGFILYICGMMLFAIVSIIIVIALGRFQKYNFGINSGDTFEKFLKDELKRFNVFTQADLDKKANITFNFSNNVLKKDDEYYSLSTMQANSSVSKIQLRLRLKTNILPPVFKDICTDYSFVTTDIRNECKIVFPREADLFFENPKVVNPSLYVRCSMAIPVFFKTKILETYNPTDVAEGASKWEEIKGIDRTLVEKTGIFVDGGTLSNFPINLFHDYKIHEPRVPIFGVSIVDEKPERERTSKVSFGDYLFKLLNTLRSNEDNSFLAINPFYKRFCISEIKVYESKEKISWLDFNMDKKKQQFLFLKGVEAALDFLEAFDWENYKIERQKI